MARPQKQTVDYFPHYTTHGKTLYVLENMYGNDGYAFWFKLLELLAATNNHVFDYNNPADWMFLLAKTRVTQEIGERILETLANLEAIDQKLWSIKVIWVQNLVDNLSEVYKRRCIKKPEKPDYESLCQQKQGLCQQKPPSSDVSDGNNPQSKVKYINTPPTPPKENPTKRKKRPSPSGDCASAFELFWSSYPKKRSKGDAEKAWIQINPSEQLLATMIATIERAKTSVDWTKENGRYIPYPASWLRSKGWEDEYTQLGREQSGNDRPSGPVPVRTYRDSDGNVRDVRTGEIIEPTNSGIPEQPGPALAIVKDLVTDLTGTGLRMVN